MLLGMDKRENGEARTLSHRESPWKLLGQLWRGREGGGLLQDQGGEKRLMQWSPDALLRQIPTPHHSSPKARCRPRDWLRQWSLARLLVHRQEGQLREGGFQPKHSTVQVNAALPWGPRMCGHLLPPPAPTPHPFREGTHSLDFPFGKK